VLAADDDVVFEHAGNLETDGEISAQNPSTQPAVAPDPGGTPG
jgi:hypothetical protein